LTHNELCRCEVHIPHCADTTLMATNQPTYQSSEEAELIESAQELVQLLINVGANPHTARTLLCLYVHGPSTSNQLQKRCMIRQPDVSIAIGELKDMGLINLENSNPGARGRPSHTYSLSVPIKEALSPFRMLALKRLHIIQEQISRISELTDSVLAN